MKHQTSFWLPRTIFTIFLLCLLGASALELYRIVPYLELLDQLSIHWKTLFLGLAFLGSLFFLGTMVIVWFPKLTSQIQHTLIRWRECLGWFCWPIALLVAGVPLYLLLFSPAGDIFVGPFTRIIIIIPIGMIVAVLTAQGKHLLPRTNLFFGFLLVGTLFYFGQQFGRVNNFPFSLTWSEGNRLYDYSLYFGKNLYIAPGGIDIVWNAPGRYLLWGIVFAIPNSPIWLHRFWDAFLWTVPFLLLGYLLARWSHLGSLARWTFTLWVVLFLAQGPIYTPLILSALIVVFLVRPNHLILSLISVAVAGYYAASSRWTWLPASAAWAALILLSNFDLRPNEPWYKVFSRLVPIGLVSAAGLIGGMFANSTMVSSRALSNEVAFSQPLLWYRLLPNSTYSQGILLGLAIAVGPLIAMMIWLYVSRRWRLNWLQALASAGALLAFLAIGLVASVKIGGGSNLHNLDMFLVTLAILSGIMLRSIPEFAPGKWPNYAQVFLALTVILPVWNTVRVGTRLELPPEEVVQKALWSINDWAHKKELDGDVLFIDQRQLLTFGYVKDIPLITDYEKKFLMNQAMEGNLPYFEIFYRDLANQRFSMIVSETLFTRQRGQVDTFGDENDSWVKWVSEPLLCYYKPITRFPQMNVQLLQPRDEPLDCPEYAIPD